MICVINYGGGNVRSVTNLLTKLGYDYCITNNKTEILSAEKIIFPGQGHFGQSMKAINDNELDVTIHKAIEKRINFLGICVGLQVLFENSEEAPKTKGLSLLKGSVLKFQKGKIPQVGWNRITTTSNNNFLDNDYFYFVNSYYVKPEDKNIISSYADYNGDFCASIEKENLCAVQFHPEKSGEAGLKFLQKWLEN